MTALRNKGWGLTTESSLEQHSDYSKSVEWVGENTPHRLFKKDLLLWMWVLPSLQSAMIPYRGMSVHHCYSHQQQRNPHFREPEWIRRHQHILSHTTYHNSPKSSIISLSITPCSTCHQPWKPWICLKQILFTERPIMVDSTIVLGHFLSTNFELLLHCLIWFTQQFIWYS